MILVYGNKNEELFAFLEAKHLQYRYVNKQLYYATIEDLVSLKMVSQRDYSESFNMIVMHHLRKSQFDMICDFMKGKGYLLAITTPTNLTWTSIKLYEELVRERESFR